RRLSAPIRRRHEPARNCVCSRHDGRNCEIASLSSATLGSKANEEVVMTHLSPDQINEYILGDRSPESEQHVQACNRCREEIAQLQDGLHLFKESVYGWAEQG